MSARLSAGQSQRQRSDTAGFFHGQLEQEGRSELEQPFDLRPAPEQERRLLMDWRLLVGRGQNEPLQIGLSEGGALRPVLLDAAIPGDDEPIVLGGRQIPDPLHIRRRAATGQIADVRGAVAEMVEETVERRGQRRRRAVVEEDLLAACRASISCRNAMARLTARTGTPQARAAASGEPSACTAETRASTGTEVSASIG